MKTHYEQQLSNLLSKQNQLKKDLDNYNKENERLRKYIEFKNQNHEKAMIGKTSKTIFK